MSLLPSVDVRESAMTACMYILVTAGSEAVEESSMLVSATGVGGGSLQDPECGRRRDLIMETHGISNSIPFVADISMERLHHPVKCLHHYGVEGTTACQGSS